MRERRDAELGSTPPAGLRRWLRRVRIALAAVIVLMLVAVLAGGLWLRAQLRGSLARLDGELRLAGLEQPVTVERDAAGVPTLRGEDRVDLSRALGFLHAQERFFQMDLLRRQAAGELAELVGAGILDGDRRRRVHRFRARAKDAIATLSAADRRHLDAYAEGVNAGLAALGRKPPEYFVLETMPAPWTPEDTLLVVYAMYFELQDHLPRVESARGLVRDVLPPALAGFLTPRGTEWDAPIVGEAYAAPAVPAPEALAPPAARGEAAAASLETPAAVAGPRPGSNNWAVAGARAAGRGAILANDMHLALRVPNTWYRASLVYPDPGGGERRVTGVTLPGGMVVIAGSNGEIAWGYTNSYGDWADLVLVEPAPGAPESYLTPDGPRAFERHRETLRVRDHADEVLEVEETIWGPLWRDDHRGRRRALRWIAHDPRAVNLGMLRFETAGDVEAAIAVAHRVGSPQQNLVVADAGGRIGWTIMGPVPRRFGHDGAVPSSWAGGDRGWDGYLDPGEVPRVVDPPSGAIWTANNRVVGGEPGARLGDGGYDLGARATQIRDRLHALDDATEADLLALQLDDRARFLERWRTLLLEVLTPEATAADPRRAEMRRLVEETWPGRAAPDSVAYRLVRGFRHELADRVYDHLTAPCRDADARFSARDLGFREGPLWRLVTERPAHLLDPRYASWDEQLLAAADEVIVQLTRDGRALAERTWGERIRLRIRHPLSRFLPDELHGWLDMPSDEVPGDDHMPRVQGAAFGASQRTVVSPGREADGIFHMPTGQSGHPLSPFYRAGHRAWVEGEATPFLPGPVAHVLRLVPAEEENPP